MSPDPDELRVTQEDQRARELLAQTARIRGWSGYARRVLAERKKLSERLRKLEQVIAEDVRTYSARQGYRVTLRPEQARDEILRGRGR